MAEKTGIAWTDSTFNPWIGCTRVSPGCDNCYAAVSRVALAMKIRWGAGEPRHRTSPGNWKLPLSWDRKAAKSERRHLVFCASLADVFDNEVPAAWRADLFKLILETPALTWLLLTKRIGNASKMIAAALGTQEQWPQSFDPAKPLPNVWLGASVVNQEEADRDVPKLLATPATKRFLSYEPALGSIDWKPFLWKVSAAACRHETRRALGIPALDWIIVGGESSQGGARARPLVIGWARDTVRQCKAAGVPVFVKQFGSNATNREGVPHPFKDRAGANPAEWPEDLRVQEFPA